MKLHHIFSIVAVVAGSLMTGCGSDEPKDAPFGNQLYIKAASMTEKIALRGAITEAVRSLRTAVPKPAAEDIRVVYKADASLAEVYNEAFYDQAVVLPSDYYELATPEVLLRKGTVLSEKVDIRFKNLDVLSRAQTYVLPVTVAQADNVSILQSRRTYYYVLKSAAMIEMVADLEKKNYVQIPTFNQSKPSAEVCNNLTQFTWEALVRVHSFPAGIQSIMGTESYFLLRISDNGLKPNQLQMVTPYGGYSNAEKCLLTPDKWTHIAMTYDMEAKEVALYIDGVEIVRQGGLLNTQPANFGKPFNSNNKDNFFHIGFSYQPGRELDGQISECRIWNVVRTPEQLLDNVYEVDPASAGLVAYWKFNEGKGKNVGDHTGKGNDGVANAVLKWTSVYLPEISE